MINQMLSSRVTLVLAAVVVCLGVVQMVHPFSGAPFNPILLILIGLLLFARYGMARQRQKRIEMMNEVKDHPLGLVDDEDK